MSAGGATVRPAWVSLGPGTTFGPGWASFYGFAGDNKPHAHHAIQLVVSREATVCIETPDGRYRGYGILVAADVEHRLVPGVCPLHLLYLDGEHGMAGALRSTDKSDVRTLSAAQAMAVGAALIAPPQALLSGVAQALGIPSEGQRTTDRRIAHLIESLDDSISDPISLSTLASRAHVSPSHLARLFRHEVGLPVRAYLRWRRLLLAIRAIASGANVTDAAATAGFSDAAHFSRTVRKTFGIEARNLLHLDIRDSTT